MQAYLSISEMVIGYQLPPHTYDPVTKVQLVRYAGASGDFNPLHSDDRAAQQAGFGGVIAHGPLVMGFIGQAIARWFPIRKLKKFSVRFKGMTVPGDIITVKATVIEKSDQALVFDVTASNQQEQVKVSGQFELSA